MPTSGSLIGPDWKLKVPGGQSSPWRPPAPPAGQSAECPFAPADSEQRDKKGEGVRACFFAGSVNVATSETLLLPKVSIFSFYLIPAETGGQAGR